MQLVSVVALSLPQSLFSFVAMRNGTSTMCRSRFRFDTVSTEMDLTAAPPAFNDNSPDGHSN